MEKAKRYYVLVNHTRASAGYSDFNAAVKAYNRKARCNTPGNKVSLVVYTDKRTEVELLSSQAHESVAA